MKSVKHTVMLVYSNSYTVENSIRKNTWNLTIFETLRVNRLIAQEMRIK